MFVYYANLQNCVLCVLFGLALFAGAIVNVTDLSDINNMYERFCLAHPSVDQREGCQDLQMIITVTTVSIVSWSGHIFTYLHITELVTITVYIGT